MKTLSLMGSHFLLMRVDMRVGTKMLVSEYASNVINNRPLKYGTRQSYFKIIKSLEIWDLEISDLNCAFIFDNADPFNFRLIISVNYLYSGYTFCCNKLRLLNDGFLMTPFHNMALMCPDTTAADVDAHRAAFKNMCRDLLKS